MKPTETNNKVIWLALIPVGGLVVFSLVRTVDNTMVQALLTCAVVGLMILAVALVARSQLGAMAQEAPPIPAADRDVLDELEPLRPDESNDKP